ncbi:MAG: alpha/beta fold hydrolase [Anaerolineae bacterium]|nr:alpha/beta fold hydrolase [Anaerolineae bacterium]
MRNQWIWRWQRPLLLLLVLIVSLAACNTPPTTPGNTAVPPTPLPPTSQPFPTQPLPTPTATPAYTPHFTPTDCPFAMPENVTIQCGYLTVPEDRANPQRTIRLPVAIVASDSPTPLPDPVVYLAGGPGGHALDQTSLLVAQFQDILHQRDLIIFDQRGVGYAEPSLDCPELPEAELANIERPLDADEQQAMVMAAVMTCRERLIADGVNLAAYNSAASAADLNDLRQVLGYESWNLLGVSYGTRLALTAVRDFGYTGAIRSAILDSVYPPQVDAYAAAGANAQRAFSLLFARCAADAACNAAYPDLETHFYQLVDALNAEPLTVTVSDHVNLVNYRVPVNGDTLIAIVFRMMYDRQLISALPQMLRQIENGYSSRLAEYMSDRLHDADFGSEGMSYSVQCFEEAPFTTEAESAAGSETLPPQLARTFAGDAANTLEICAAWQIAPAQPKENEPVISDVPTLLLVGDYDPITPPAYAETAAAHLPNSFLFTFIGVSHAVTFNHSCGVDLVAAFLADPNKEPTADCLPSMPLGFLRP